MGAERSVRGLLQRKTGRCHRLDWNDGGHGEKRLDSEHDLREDGVPRTYRFIRCWGIPGHSNEE